MSAGRPDERSVVALAAALQLVVILDFALVLPLGPDLVEPLAIPASSLGLLVAVYTGAAIVGGLLGARVLDRVDRSRALRVALVGLALADCAAALAPSYAALLGARMLAGVCAAPISALIMSTIADEIPASRRGRALGVVLSANAVAGVIGVPLLLWLAGWLGWEAAFAGLGLVALAVMLGVSARVRGRGPQRRAPHDATPPPLRAVVRLSHALIFVGFACGFVLTANISAYLQLNLGYPRADIPLLYLVASACSFVAVRFGGRAVDRFGALRVGTVAIVALASFVGLTLAVAPPQLPLELGVVGILVCLGGRNVALKTATSRVPDARTRARFMSNQAVAQQLGAATGALIGFALLDDLPDGSLTGMSTLALCSIALSCAIPPLLKLIERAPERAST